MTCYSITISKTEPSNQGYRATAGEGYAARRGYKTFHQSLGLASCHGEKKDGTMRFCVDFRKMNDATIKDAHPLPRIDDTLESLHGAQYFTTLDLKSGCWQVPIKEEDKEKTAFRTSSGQLYEFNQLPFGLCNAPATFSRLMDRTLAGLAWNICLYYLDDIIVFSSTWAEHLE